MFKTALKLILRNWWRNKTFTFISILSLTVGIACTNLLAAFVIYENGIEISNPNINKMAWAMQDIPSLPGEKLAYVSKGIPEQMMSKFPEITDYLQINSFEVNYIETNNHRYEPISVLNVNPSFPGFFPFELLYGSWNTFNNPNSIIISEKQAKRFYRNENPLGKEIKMSVNDFESEIVSVYTIGAVTKNRDQSAVIFDALICNPETNWGGPTLLMLTEDTNLNQFEEKTNNSQIPTMAGGKYYFTILDDALSMTYNKQTLEFWHHRDNNLLLVGFISAVLVLLISLFNYINMSLSRLLQQINSVKVQKFMGAKNRDIRLQLLGDSFLLVLISLFLSLLLMFDILPVLKQTVSSEFSVYIFFNSSFFLFFILFILLLTAVPSFIISRKIKELSNEKYRIDNTVNKRKWVDILVTLQFIFTIALIIAMINVNRQVDLVRSTGNKYQNVIEIGSSNIHLDLTSFKKSIVNLPGIHSISAGNLPILNSAIIFSTLKNEKGEVTPASILEISGDSELLDVYNINQLSGDSWKLIHENNQNCVLVNETFVDMTNTIPEKIIGEPLLKYLETDDSLLIIAGVVKDFQFNTVEEKVMPVMIKPNSFSDQFPLLHIRLKDKNQSETLNSIKTIWNQMFPEENFIYDIPYETYIQRNEKVLNVSQLLRLYSIISLILVCFGLFGISYYAVRVRTKEIGIRKINGAKTHQVLWLLIKPVFLWIIIGFTIGTPLAWLVIDLWLQQFAYRVDITLASCLLGLIIVTSVSLLTVTWHTLKTARKSPAEILKSD